MSKFIKTAGIVDPNTRLPFAAKSLNWLQTAFKEQFATITEWLTNYTTPQVIVLKGAKVTYTGPTGGTASVLAGWVYYNGEIYQAKANPSLNIGTGQIPVWTIQSIDDQTINGGSGNDLTTMSDGTQQSVHMTDFFVLVSGPAGGSTVTGYVCDWNSTNIVNFSISKTLGVVSIPPSVGIGNFSASYSLEICGPIKKLIVNINNASWNSAASGFTSITLDLSTPLAGNTIDYSGFGNVAAINIIDIDNVPATVQGGYISASSGTQITIIFPQSTTGHHYDMRGQIILQLN